MFKNIVVSMTDSGVLGKHIQGMGVSVFTLNIRRRAPNPVALWRLINLLRRERIQILQTWLYHADLMGLLAGKLASTPAIAWNLRCSELSTDDHPRLLFLIMRILAKLSYLTNTVIVNSSAGRAFHESLGYKPSRWIVIPNGVDIQLFCPSPLSSIALRSSLGLSKKTPLIGLVARFHPMKDHTTFLKAASRLIKHRPDVHFVLAGKEVNCQNPSLMQQVSNYGLSSNVHLLGEVHNIANITTALDIATCSSYSEGFPNAIAEAMACGVPCVATDVGDLSHIVNGTGRVVPPRDHFAMSEAWTEILGMSEDDRQALGKCARERVVSLFSLDSMTGQYENLYYEIDKSKNKR
jgi:glycosyltransferase involved in cell wall biosynthesis